MKISIGFFTQLALVFITLKLLGKIDWSWWWVLSPLWAPPATVLALVVIFVVLLGVALLFAVLMQ